MSVRVFWRARVSKARGVFTPSTLRLSSLGVLAKSSIHGLLRKLKHLYKKKRKKEKEKEDSSSGIRIFDVTYENVF